MKTHFLLTILLLSITCFVSGQKDNLVEISNISIDSMGDLRWTVTYIESLDGLSQKIEQFKDNKWVVVGDAGYSIILTKSSDDSGEPSKWVSTKKSKNDSVRVKFHKGENKFRIRVTVPGKATSSEVVLTSKVSNDDGSLWIVGNKIILDYKVQFEILNHLGATIMKGEDKTIDINSLPKGSYFFYTKTSTRPFLK